MNQLNGRPPVGTILYPGDFVRFLSGFGDSGPVETAQVSSIHLGKNGPTANQAIFTPDMDDRTYVLNLQEAGWCYIGQVQAVTPQQSMLDFSAEK